jgi:hypothetical protein
MLSGKEYTVTIVTTVTELPVDKVIWRCKLVVLLRRQARTEVVSKVEPLLALCACSRLRLHCGQYRTCTQGARCKCMCLRPTPFSGVGTADCTGSGDRLSIQVGIA